MTGGGEWWKRRKGGREIQQGHGAISTVGVSREIVLAWLIDDDSDERGQKEESKQRSMHVDENEQRKKR